MNLKTIVSLTRSGAVGCCYKYSDILDASLYLLLYALIHIPFEFA